MAYGLDERLRFIVSMGKNNNGWSAHIRMIHPKMSHGMGQIGGDLDFDEAIKGVIDTLKCNLEIKIKQGKWPVFIDTTVPKSGISEHIDR